jgi:hypothetical protein
MTWYFWAELMLVAGAGQRAAVGISKGESRQMETVLRLASGHESLQKSQI